MEERSIEIEENALDRLRRYVRILVDLGRLAGEKCHLGRYLDQAVLQIARAVEIHHVKILQYRPGTSDLLLVAGVGWKEGAVGTATLSADLRSPPRVARFRRQSRSPSKTSRSKRNTFIRIF
jgi:two-component system, sensor histidine kinase PdtaS